MVIEVPDGTRYSFLHVCLAPTMTEEEFYSSNFSEEEKRRMQEAATAAQKQQEKEAQINSATARIETANQPAGQPGAMGSTIQREEGTAANVNPDNLAKTEFAGSMDPESYNFRMTDDTGQSFLRENAGPDEEKRSLVLLQSLDDMNPVDTSLGPSRIHR